MDVQSKKEQLIKLYQTISTLQKYIESNLDKLIYEGNAQEFSSLLLMVMGISINLLTSQELS